MIHQNPGGIRSIDKAAGKVNGVHQPVTGHKLKLKFIDHGAMNADTAVIRIKPGNNNNIFLLKLYI